MVLYARWPCRLMARSWSPDFHEVQWRTPARAKQHVPDGRLGITGLSAPTLLGFSGPVQALALQSIGNICRRGVAGLFNETSSNRPAQAGPPCRSQPDADAFHAHPDTDARPSVHNHRVIAGETREAQARAAIAERHAAITTTPPRRSA